MSWEMHEAAKKIADGWYSELETTRKRNAVLERENVKLRELVRDMWEIGFGDNSGANNAWEWHERADELEGRMSELGIGVGADA